MGYRVAIVGATGNVGREMLNILEELEFPVDEIHAIASRKSKGVEVSFGDWEGYTLAELAKLYPERAAEREHVKWDFIPPGATAESYEILSWRVGSWLSSVTRPTVCVCHGGVIRSLFRIVGGRGTEESAMTDTPQDRILSLDPVQGRIDWV